MPAFSDPGPGSSSVTLSEAVQAVRDVLEEAHAELGAVHLRLGDEELDPDLELDEDALDAPTDTIRHVAARLEGCAGALREAAREDSS